MDFFVELGLDVGALDLQVLQGVDASLYNFGQTGKAKTNTGDKLSGPECFFSPRVLEDNKIYWQHQLLSSDGVSLAATTNTRQKHVQ